MVSVDNRLVLIIDDDEVDRERVRRSIAGDYQVIEADLGSTGVNTFLERQPDCVLLDYLLPDSHGLDVLDDLAHHQATVVMLTGEGNEQIAVDAMKHGAQDYLPKGSLQAGLLKRAIVNAIEKSDLQQKIRDQQEQLQQHAEELQRSNEELQQFAYVASHDLQEPLRSVSSFCNLLQERYQGQFDEQADRWMTKIVRGAERMKTMIQDLLTYSRVESRGGQFRPTDCQQLFDHVMTDLTMTIRQASATVTNDELPTVIGDERQLAQLLQNLISNAIKYRGEQPPTVHVGAEHDERGWKFSVADNGIGISPEHFERIFQMFKRLHTRDQYDGTGIGLSLCERIVRRHGGKLWVESQPGLGSTFSFTIPHIEPTEGADDAPVLGTS